MMKFSLTILGCRGSVPVHGEQMLRYGGATTCYRIDTEDQVIFLDAGSGILSVRPESLAGKQVSLLFSHPHLDHLIGLPFFSALMEKRELHFYGADREGRTLKEQLEELLRSPYWPCGIDDFPADVRWHKVGESKTFAIGDVSVQTMEVPHPGGCTAYRLTRGDRSIAVLTDAELPENPQGECLSFMKGADLLLCDGQYTPEEAGTHRGYGHTSMDVSAAWAEASGVGKALLVHHDPTHNDAFLDEAEKKYGSARLGFARVGEVFDLGDGK